MEKVHSRSSTCPLERNYRERRHKGNDLQWLRFTSVTVYAGRVCFAGSPAASFQKMCVGVL